MKKFLKKKGTMIGSIVAAAVVLVLLLVFCIRPVSLWYNYKFTEDDVVTKYRFGFNEVTMTMEKDGKEAKNEGYYFVKEGIVVPVNAKDKEDFKEKKESMIDNWDITKEMYKGMEINAFTFDMYGEKLVCVGAIVTVAILGVIEVVLAGMAVSSIILRKKK